MVDMYTSELCTIHYLDMYIHISIWPALTLRRHRLTNKLVVQEQNLDHNHHIGTDVAAHYSANRNFSEVEKDASFSTLLNFQWNTESQPKQSMWRSWLRASMGNLFLEGHSIHNLKSRMKTEAWCSASSSWTWAISQKMIYYRLVHNDVHINCYRLPCFSQCARTISRLVVDKDVR